MRDMGWVLRDPLRLTKQRGRAQPPPGPGWELFASYLPLSESSALSSADFVASFAFSTVSAPGCPSVPADAAAPEAFGSAAFMSMPAPPPMLDFTSAGLPSAGLDASAFFGLPALAV